MNIRRIVPIVGHALAHRHMPAEGYLKTVAPIAEIGEGNNRFLGHAGEVAQDGFHVLHGLDGLAEHNHIEAAVAERLQTLLQISLNHVHAAGDGGNHAAGVDFHAVAFAVFVLHQGVQQFAVAAAQIQHAAALGNPVVNQLQVVTQIHAPTPCGYYRYRLSRLSNTVRLPSGRHHGRGKIRFRCIARLFPR